MAFPKKTWKDRVSEQPQRRLITPVGGGTATTVDVTRQEGIVIQEGDAFSAANMNDLENRIKTALDTDEASIQTINTKSTTNANNIASLQNNVNTLMSIKAPNYHASQTATFGIGKPTEFGHLKISDGAYEGNAAAGVAASSNLVGVVNDKVDAIQNELTANGNRIYMDYQNGKYGYNTSANRGADTFHPFNRGFSITYTHPGIPYNSVPIFLGYSNGVLQLGKVPSGDQLSISGALEEYVVTNCKHIVFEYEEIHGDGRGSLYIDGTLVASNTSYSGDLDPNVTHTIQVRALDYHHQFSRGYTFTFDV